MPSGLRAATALLFFSLSSSLWAAPAGPATAPSPRLSPAEVVQVQLDALAHNDTPARDAGIAVVWRFASPGNQSQTGPQARFTQMVHDGYGDMIDHGKTTLASTVIQNGQALQGVELVDQAGITHRYVFILSKQTEPPYKDCWMTDAVVGSPEDARTPKQSAQL